MHGRQMLMTRSGTPTLTISPVGSVASGTTTVSVSPQNIGDILVVTGRLGNGTPTVSGGGVTTWTLLAEQPYWSVSGGSEWIYWGIVTATGSQTITVSGTGSGQSYCQEFSKSGGTWAADGNGSYTENSSGTVAMPSLTPTSSGAELYFGAVNTQAPSMPAGSTSGYTYAPSSPAYGGIVYNAACSEGVVQAPTWPSTGYPWGACAGLVQIALPPVSPVSGYSAWYDASQITSVADGASLASWSDLSGNGNTMAATGTAEPTYYKTTSAKLVNGLPAVWFNGSTNIMATSSPISTARTGVTMFVVTQNTAGGAYYGGLAPFCNGGGPSINTYNSPQPNGYFGWLSNGVAWEATTTPANTGLNAICLALGTSAGTTAVYLNGAQLSSTGYSEPNTPSGPALLGGHFIGTPGDSTGQYLTGPLCEALFYPSLLSAANILSVFNYLNHKWGT
jgi:hypothetical protein